MKENFEKYIHKKSTTLLGKFHNNIHFTDEETKTWRSQAARDSTDSKNSTMTAIDISVTTLQ